MGDLLREEQEYERPSLPAQPLWRPLQVERPSSTAMRRETALWQTLADIGITPHDDQSSQGSRPHSHDGTMSHVSSVEHPHAE